MGCGYEREAFNQHMFAGVITFLQESCPKPAMSGKGWVDVPNSRVQN